MTLCSAGQMLIAQELEVVASPSPLFNGLRSPLCRSVARHKGSRCGVVGTFSYTFCCFKQKHYYLSHPFQRKVFFFHLTLQSILFCADVGGRMLKSSLAKEQVCLSNKNKQTAKCVGEAALKIARDIRLSGFY